MDWRERIIVDPAILVGKPMVKGTRLAVEFVVDILARGVVEKGYTAELSRLDPRGHKCMSALR